MNPHTIAVVLADRGTPVVFIVDARNSADAIRRALLTIEEHYDAEVIRVHVSRNEEPIRDTNRPAVGQGAYGSQDSAGATSGGDYEKINQPEK